MRYFGILLFAICGVVLVWGAATPALAQQSGPARYCGNTGTDDHPRPIPAMLVPSVQKLFGIPGMDPARVQRSTSFRCFRGAVLVCTAGANLPCTKANVRTAIPGANGFCAVHPGADSVPTSATGPATIYLWRCDGPLAVVAGTARHVDARGFIQESWRVLN
jgi:hypothetical protein